MDIFIEHIVKKKRDFKTYLISFGSVFLAIILVMLTGNLMALLGPMFGSFSLLFVCGIIYGMYLIISSQNLEYEYSVTNSELDIDKIISRRRRKRVLTLDVKTVEIIAPRSHEDFKRSFENSNLKKIYTCSSVESNELYFAVFEDTTGKKMLLFEPTEKMLNAFKKFIPRKVFTQ